MTRRLALLALMLVLMVVPHAAAAQGLNFENLLPSGDQTVTGRMVQIILVVTMLSVAPGLLMMVTCFTRFVIVLSLLRSGLGLQTTPANMILVSLALFMTFFVMAPTLERAWIHLNGGARMEADHIEESAAGVWYRRGSLAIFIDRSRAIGVSGVVVNV